MWILLAMIVVMPFEKNPYLHIDESLLGLPNLTVIKLLGLIGLIWGILQTFGRHGRPALLSTTQARALLSFSVLLAFAALSSGSQFLVLTRFLAVVCLVFLVTTAVQRESDIWLTVHTLALVMILVFPYALRQMLRYGGRLGVGLNEPNYTALALLVPIPLTIVLAARQHVPWKRRLWLLGTGLLILQVVLTGSRGGLLGLVAVLVLAALRLSRRKLMTTCIVLLLLLLIVNLPTTLGQRLWASLPGSDSYDSGIQASNAARLDILKTAINIVSTHPLTGVGLGNFKSRSVAYGASNPHLAHMTYLEVAAELGIPAFLAFLGVLWATLRSLGRSRWMALRLRRLDLANLAGAMQVGLLGWMLSAAFLSAQYEKFFWLTVALSIPLERVVTSSWTVAATSRQHDEIRFSRSSSSWAKPATPARTRQAFR
jgi:O-antigen ligase